MFKKSIVVIAVCFLCGCYAVKGAYNDVVSNPSAFMAESENTNEGIAVVFPETAKYPALIGLGYLFSFLRRVYANRKRKESENA